MGTQHYTVVVVVFPTDSRKELPTAVRSSREGRRNLEDCLKPKIQNAQHKKSARGRHIDG